MANKIEALYKQYYLENEPHFERLAIFSAVQSRYGGTTALYPGCLIHLTPSFFFPHVVYVDTSPEARAFFAARKEVLAFVDRRKRYKRPAYIDFIHADYTAPLSLRPESFDLLISLYAGGIALACKRYLRPGGLLLSNNHQDDAGQAAADPDYRLVAVAHEKGAVCRLEEDHLEGYFVPKKAEGRGGAGAQHNPWPAYTRTASYYLFQKLPPRAG